MNAESEELNRIRLKSVQPRLPIPQSLHGSHWQLDRLMRWDGKSESGAGPVERPLRDLREHSGKLFGRCRAPDFWPPLRVWLGQLLASFGAPGHKRASCLEVF
jgi:hypothetical protein